MLSEHLEGKALELLEAHHLFLLPSAKLDVVIHPQSIVHCLVHLSDGSVLAQMSCPDMRTPIAYSLAWPERMEAPTKRLDLAELGTLTFEAPDIERFPALRLAREVLAAGGRLAVPLVDLALAGVVGGDSGMEKFFGLAVALGQRAARTFDVRASAVMVAFEEDHPRPHADRVLVVSGEIMIEPEEQ